MEGLVYLFEEEEEEEEGRTNTRLFVSLKARGGGGERR